MPIIRKRLVSSDVYPDDIRYNPDTETVQSKVNDEWVDNPALDPRTQTTYPPRITSDTQCDAAQSIADALKNQLDQILEAIDNASTAFTIAGLILGLFSFGVFAIFISIALFIADQMIAIGSTALEAALTPTAYETLVCIIRCRLDSNGRVKSGEFGLIISDINDQIGGVAALVFTSMISLAGEGGINNLASLGTSDGDCSECDDCPCGFIVSGDAGGWEKFGAGSDLSLFDWSPAIITFNFSEEFEWYFAAGYSVTTPNEVLAIRHTFDEPCAVGSVTVGVDGRSAASRIIFYKKVSGTWSIVLNSVGGSTSAIDLTAEYDDTIEAIQIEFFTQSYAIIQSVNVG